MSMFPIASSILRAQLPRERIAIGQGIITSMYAGDAVIGLSIGGFIIQDYGWHVKFFTIIPITVGLLFIIWRFVIILCSFPPSSHRNASIKLTLSDGFILCFIESIFLKFFLSPSGPAPLSVLFRRFYRSIR
jgi:predicted MFS family arabinose efflux permease